MKCKKEINEFISSKMWKQISRDECTFHVIKYASVYPGEELVKHDWRKKDKYTLCIMNGMPGYRRSLEDQIRLSNFYIPSQKRRCLDWPIKSAWQRLGKIKAISKLLFLSISKRAGSSPQHTEVSRISYSVTLGK